MRRPTQRALEDRLRVALASETELPAIAETVYTAIAAYVPYDFACLATTDPASGVVTWASKTRDLGVGDEEFAACEYGGPDINQFTDLAHRTPPVGLLSVDTDGMLDRCRRHREFMAPRFGFTDELRAVFTRRGATWGALGLYRGPGDPPFTPEEGRHVAGVCDLVTEAIQRSLFRLESSPATAPTPARSEPDSAGPAVLIVDGADRITHVTPAARRAIEDLGGFDHGSLPANVLGVVATTRSGDGSFSTSAQAADGRWLSLRAVRLDDGTSRSDVVVTIEPTPRSTLSRLALAAHGLTAREEEVAALVLQGVDTAGIASALHLSPHTVQDHLKVVFTKLGVSSRREMTARLVLG